MPYADPERKRERMRQWRKESIADGYGKWLYARRKLRFNDAERFRNALEEIVHGSNLLDIPPDIRVAMMRDAANRVLGESQEAEDALGPWKGRDDDQRES